jgi:hypothetical protein
MSAVGAIRMTKEEWLERGKVLFGEDFYEWRFVCPICGNVAAVKDYKPYKDKGAHANSATCECIGRYTGAQSSFDGTKPCNYAGYGLFRLSPVIVLDDGKEIHSFAFAEATTHGERPETTETKT